MSAKVTINPVSQILREHGLNPGGHVQRFHTSNVLRRIKRYMPYRSGMLIKKTVAATDIAKPLIVTPGPEARMLYHGKVMVDPKTGKAGFLTDDGWKSRRGVAKVPSNRDLVYTTSKNAQAGPYWDRRLKAAEMPVITRELQNYIDRRG